MKAYEFFTYITNYDIVMYIKNEVRMQRTQIYFEEHLLEEIKEQANQLNISMSAYIRTVLKKDLQKKKNKPDTTNLSDFAGMWRDRDITQESIREKAWK